MYAYSRASRSSERQGRQGCSTMMECISKGEGCPMYSKLIVSALLALLLYVVMEFIGEQMCKHKFDSWGDVLVVTRNNVCSHEYETKMWVKVMNLAIGIIVFFLTWRHLSRQYNKI